jgi:glycosyltransferase involved in cell wall biosynthesis
LCTNNNRHLLPVAIASYLSQDWPDKELVVIDDGTDRVQDLFEDIPGCTYVYLPNAVKNLSVKRNVAVRASQGEAVIHFDSDDWSASTRVRHQVETLIGNPEAQISGYHTAFFWDEIDQQASCYHGSKNYSWGPCLCYRKSFALANPWPEQTTSAEDNEFVRVAQNCRQIVSIDGSGQIVVRLHSGNARRPVGSGDWPFVPREALPEEFWKLIEPSGVSR